MEVFIYQIVIAALIIISGYSGKKAKVITTIIIALFTITHIFMPWLMILQFITIAISFSVASYIANKKDEQKKLKMLNSSVNSINEPMGLMGIFGILFLLFAIIAMLYSFASFLGYVTGWFDVDDWF
ncbi:hypothetical protein [Algibacter luteus]|uniref:hypothetical protein n=1 Tax=Algibacter luteus TaxID=1178825 RepID=UPI0025970989|nr:hypothetical protein [Algibacter luteus]WJJ96348.1 hypothetical protein O5O44_14130 [Algibacter luteus]